MVYLFVFFYNYIIRVSTKMYVLFFFVFLPFLASRIFFLSIGSQILSRQRMRTRKQLFRRAGKQDFTARSAAFRP